MDAVCPYILVPLLFGTFLPWCWRIPSPHILGLHVVVEVDYLDSDWCACGLRCLWDWPAVACFHARRQGPMQLQGMEGPLTTCLLSPRYHVRSLVTMFN